MPGSMTPQELRALENLPLDESRSRLEPYRELILRWRRQGRGYTRIRELLAEKCSVTISRQVLTRFIKRRSRPRKVQPDFEMEPSTMQRLESVSQAAASGKRLSAEERAAQVEFIRSLNQKPVLEEQPKPGWNFDTDKPRTIQKS